MRLAYQFRIYPTKAQRRRMEDPLEHCRLLYNAGLEQRRTAYQVSMSRSRKPASKPTRPH
jgi:transposase